MIAPHMHPQRSRAHRQPRCPAHAMLPAPPLSPWGWRVRFPSWPSRHCSVPLLRRHLSMRHMLRLIATTTPSSLMPSPVNLWPHLWAAQLPPPAVPPLKVPWRGAQEDPLEAPRGWRSCHLTQTMQWIISFQRISVWGSSLRQEGVTTTSTWNGWRGSLPTGENHCISLRIKQIFCESGQLTLGNAPAGNNT